MADTKLSAIVAQLTSWVGTERSYWADGSTSKYGLASDLRDYTRKGRTIASQLNFTPPATLGAQPIVRTGGSSPAENVPQGFRFDPTTDWMIDAVAHAPAWFIPANGMNIIIPTWTAATSGNMVFQAAIRRLSTSDVLTTAHTYVYNSTGAVAANGTANTMKYLTVSLASGDLDGLLAGEDFILRIRRDADNTSATDSITATDVNVSSFGVTVEEP